MTEALTIGWSNARAEASRGLYRRTLGLNLFLHLLIGLACILLPHWISATFGLPGPIPAGWVRGWGAMLILVSALYTPGLIDPFRVRLPNLIGLGGRLWLTIIWLFCGGGFLWFALFDFLFFVILARLYLRFLTNTLMTRP
ncbi:hypothetical protein [Mesorhizobium sp.]|uniref:hypothetical protein n=1 Tax=Mesorhizobium sp. TaxID=1871066 RepID=UPI00120B42D0|nr:hypothetical protein [Mesorhizobium sp.]TIT04405.1 MAG: hypothetical protein E5W87_00010 [Mesorhizobium sp.]